MTVARKNLMILICLVSLLALGACTREITVTEVQSSGPENCFSCHTDQESFMVAAELQWANSVHASGLNTNRSNASCAACHTGDGFIAVANGGEAEDYDNPMVIHCFVCHQPHTDADFGLRVDTPVTTENGVMYDIGVGNLCAQCHHARYSVDVRVSSDGTNISNTHWGPHHSPQADVLFGANAYQFAGAADYRVSMAHRDNGRGCVKCHFDVTRNFIVGGHSFNMRGAFPIEEGNEAEWVTNEGACTQCHDDFADPIDDDDFYFDHESIQTDVEALLEELAVLLEAEGLLSGGHPEPGMADGEAGGALWNYLLAEEDRSFGVHNPKYVMDMLQASVDYMETK